MSLAELIRVARERRGLTRERVASETGIPFGTLRSWELGPTEKPSIQNLARLARYLGINGETVFDAALRPEGAPPDALSVGGESSQPSPETEILESIATAQEALERINVNVHAFLSREERAADPGREEELRATGEGAQESLEGDAPRAERSGTA